MPSARKTDPIGVFNFSLTLIDVADQYQVAGFSECSGLEATVEVIDYKEGGVNDYVHKFPTRASFANITLKHGVIYLYDDLWSWHYDFVQGKGKRKDGTIILCSMSPGRRRRSGSSNVGCR